MFEVAAGAVLGALLRHLSCSLGLPVLFVNVLGCFAAGMFYDFGLNKFFIVGFAGSLTTFSAFIIEQYEGYQSFPVFAFKAVIISATCFVAFWGGLKCS